MTAKRIGARHAALRIMLLAGTALAATAMGFTASYADDRGGDHDGGHFQFEPGTLVISSATYEKTQGPIRTLMAGTRLGTAATAPAAIADNNFVKVWNNT